MQIGKWGNSLAIRLPKTLIEKLGLGEGDELDEAVLEQAFLAEREARREAAVARMQARRLKLPANWKFGRNRLHEDDMRDRGIL